MKEAAIGDHQAIVTERQAAEGHFAYLSVGSGPSSISTDDGTPSTLWAASLISPHSLTDEPSEVQERHVHPAVTPKFDIFEDLDLFMLQMPTRGTAILHDVLDRVGLWYGNYLPFGNAPI